MGRFAETHSMQILPPTGVQTHIAMRVSTYMYLSTSTHSISVLSRFVSISLVCAKGSRHSTVITKIPSHLSYYAKCCIITTMNSKKKAI